MSKAGRPKGITGRGNISPADKEAVKRAFIAGKKVSDIVKEFHLGGYTNIYKWAEEGDWFAERDKFFRDLSRKELDMAFEGALSTSEKTINDISVMKEKAMTAIKEGIVTPQYFGETTKAYMSAVELERRMRIEGLQLSFITEVAKILKRNIHDPALLGVIGEELKQLFFSYQNKALPTETDNG